MTPSLSTLVDTAWTVLVPLLDDVPEADEVRPGGLAIVLMVSLIVATILLWLSMRRQLGKVKFDDRLDDDEVDDPDAAASPTGPVDEDTDHRS